MKPSIAILIAVSVALLVGCDPGRIEAERAVKSVLIDPGSARFTNVSRHPETGAYCGWVNSRNKFGGYTGDKSFAFNDGTVVFLPDPQSLQRSVREFERAVERMGRGTGSVEEMDRALEAANQEQERFGEALDLFLKWCDPDLRDERQEELMRME